MIGKQLADQVRSLDNTRPLTLAFPGTTTAPNAEAVFSLLDITGYNYNLIPTYAADHRQLPKRIMLTTESYPAKAFPLWQISQDNPYVLGDLTWTAMDYLGESGIGAWSYGTPEQAQMAEQMMGGMVNTSMVDKMFLGMANGVDMMAAMAQGPADPAMKAAMAVMFHGYPWHAAACGDLDLTGYRKPQSYYRDILWNGGDRVYATVRLPEPEGKKIIAVGWATYPTLPTWSWPGQEGKELQVEVYSGAEKVRLYLNDKLIGEKPTGREQEFKATFSVPYAPGTLKAVGVRGDRAVAESVLTTAGKPAASARNCGPHSASGRRTGPFVPDSRGGGCRGSSAAPCRPGSTVLHQRARTIAAVGNGDGQDDASYQGDRRKLFQGRALVVVRTSRQAGPITITARTRRLKRRIGDHPGEGGRRARGTALIGIVTRSPNSLKGNVVMELPSNPSEQHRPRGISRRKFLGHAAGAAALTMVSSRKITAALGQAAVEAVGHRTSHCCGWSEKPVNSFDPDKSLGSSIDQSRPR